MTDVDTGNGHVLSLPVKVSLREAMAQFATGVTIVTVGGQRGHGMTANAFTSVSLDPPLVLVCVAKAARLHAAILADGCFAVSVLGADQAHVARYFANRGRPAGMAQFDAVQWRPGTCTGAPLLGGALAWLECDVVEVHEGGDHSIFLGRVLECSRGNGGGALVFHAGAFGGPDKSG